MGASLQISDLRRVAERLAAHAETWRHLVRHDPDERTFERILDASNAEGWLICWMPGHDTGFHDHGSSSGAVTVVAGQVREERLRPESAIVERVYPAGETFDFSRDDIHRVSHFGDEPALTLHVYSPRILDAGAYTLEPGGVLRRHPVPSDQELRPLEAA